MSAISCAVNFKENFTKNIPYYKLLLKQINDAQAPPLKRGGIFCEHTAIACKSAENVISKICEGYQFIIAFDGELLNSDSLKQELKSLGYCFSAENDAELALNAYIHFGEKAPEKLEGNFSFIIYDTMRRQFFAASDALASIPLFYTRHESLYIFASQIRGIFAHPDIVPKISVSGLSQLFSFSRACQKNVFENISMLPPAHILKIKDGDFVLKKYAPKKTENISCDLFSLLSDSISESSDKAPSVIHLGTLKDDLLFSVVAKNSLKNHLRTTVYSFSMSDIFKKYSAEHSYIVLDENLLFSALENCVCVSGLPTLSESDFLLELAFRHIPKASGTVFTSLPDIFSNKCTNQHILEKNNAFHPAVLGSLVKLLPKEVALLNSAYLLAKSNELTLKSPFLCPNVYDFLINSAKPHNELFYDTICDNFGKINPSPSSVPNLSAKLKRILLEIIADDSAPILSFFNKSALLRLCECGFDLSCGNLTDQELVSYIIKLNIWFLKYRPTIV